MVFYPDRFLLLDYIFCFCTLLVYGVASRQEIRWLRMTVAAFAASLFSLAGVMLRIYGIYSGMAAMPAFFMASLYVVSKLCFGGKARRVTGNAFGVGFVTVAEGGVLVFILMIMRVGGALGKKSVPIAVIFSLAFQFLFLIFLGRMGKTVLKMQKSALIVIEGQSFTALIDSGNLLRDGKGSPVVVFSSLAALRLERICEDVFAIEVHTAVGKEILKGGYIRKTLIYSSAGRADFEHMAVCFTTKESFGGQFDAVVPEELICNKSG